MLCRGIVRMLFVLYLVFERGHSSLSVVVLLMVRMQSGLPASRMDQLSFLSTPSLPPLSQASDTTLTILLSADT